MTRNGNVSVILLVITSEFSLYKSGNDTQVVEKIVGQIVIITNCYTSSSLKCCETSVSQDPY